MSRLRARVITSADVKEQKRDGAVRGPGDTSGVEDGAVSKIIKYIPAEVIALHQALSGFSVGNEKLVAILIGVLAALTPIWYATSTRDAGEPIQWSQVVLSSLAFAFWLFAVKSPALALVPGLNLSDQAGTILFVFFMGITPLLEKIVTSVQGR